MTTEQALPIVGVVAVAESLGDWLRERTAKGIETYGRPLETFNGRSAPRDLREELVDALQYAHQWELERDTLLAQVKRLEVLLAVSHHGLTYAEAAEVIGVPIWEMQGAIYEGVSKGVQTWRQR